MQLQCLGTAGYHPNETRHTSCYFLPEAGVMLDAGTGVFRLNGRIRTPTLDILLSHAHLDHVVGMTFLLGVLFQNPVEQVRVWGESEKLAAIRTHLISEYLFPIDLPVSWCPIDDHGAGDNHSSIQLSTCRMSWRPQNHPGGSVAYRLDFDSDGDPATHRSLIYATDSTGDHDAETLQWMSNADVMLHECNFYDHQKEWAFKTGHCYVGRVAEISHASRPRRLFLTHINPAEELVLADDESRFACPVEVVSDRQNIDF